MIRHLIRLAIMVKQCHEQLNENLFAMSATLFGHEKTLRR
jgi:hypothetical protein